jgi:hypothetical protein
MDIMNSTNLLYDGGTVSYVGLVMILVDEIAPATAETWIFGVGGDGSALETEICIDCKKYTIHPPEIC